MSKSKFFALLILNCLAVPAAFAKLSLQQLDEAHKAYDKALYGTVYKIVGKDVDKDYAASLIDSMSKESYDCDAAQHFLRTSELAPQKSLVAMWKGYSLFLSRKYGPSQVQLSEAIRLDPKNALAHALLGCCLCYADEVDHGMAEIKAAQKIDPKTSFDEYTARGFVGAVESQKAEVAFNKLVSEHPNSARIYILRADYFDEAGRFKQALADDDKAIQLSPQSQYAHFRKARLLNQMKMYAQAIPEAIKGSSLEKIDEFGTKSMRVLSDSYEHTNQWQKAIDVLKPMYMHVVGRTRWLSGTERLGLLELAEDYEKIHDYKNAKATVDIVFRLEPKSKEALAKRARYNVGLNDFGAALHDYTALISADPTNPQWHTERAKIFQKLGKAESASADLKKAKELEE